jgi:hypothetical protein
MGRRYTGRKTVLWRKSARASSLCQEPDAAAMADFGGSVQLDYCRNRSTVRFCLLLILFYSPPPVIAYGHLYARAVWVTIFFQ